MSSHGSVIQAEGAASPGHCYALPKSCGRKATLVPKKPPRHAANRAYRNWGRQQNCGGDLSCRSKVATEGHGRPESKNLCPNRKDNQVVPNEARSETANGLGRGSTWLEGKASWNGPLRRQLEMCSQGKALYSAYSTKSGSPRLFILLGTCLVQVQVPPEVPQVLNGQQAY